MKKHKSTKKILLTVFCIIVILIGAFYFAIFMYTKDYYHASDSVMTYMDNPGPNVTVTCTDDMVVCMPDNPVAGVIFYPGALVEYTAYVPLMEQLAENNIATIILRMNRNLALFSIDAAKDVPSSYSMIDTWYMSGHSLGGAMASVFVAKHQTDYDGLILLASYPSKPLDETQVKVLCLRGSNDEVLNLDSYEKNLQSNAPFASEVLIDGGIHAYFGDYGAQKGDGTPTISRSEQQEQTVKSIVNFINN